MPASLDVIELTDMERGELERLTRAGTSAQRLVSRATIVLLAAAGHPNTVIAARVGAGVDTVRKWRHRWCCRPGLRCLEDAKRSGRPSRFTPAHIAGVKALACQPPEASGVPLSGSPYLRWGLGHAGRGDAVR